MKSLNRIYTKSGDRGETRLGDNTKVPKTHPRIRAYGGVDELNAVIGVAMALGELPSELLMQLKRIQNDLFDVGGDLCIPEPESPPETPQLRVTQAQVECLERWIDAATSQLQPLTSFILPGGSPGAALLHQARTVCRRVEVDVVALAEQERVNPQAVIYLNRLSDLLFVMARLTNDGGKADVLWIPGGERQS